MADPISLQIIKALVTRLEAITTAGGYNNDPTIVRGVQIVNADQVTSAPVISVYDESDDPTEDQNFCQTAVVNLSITLEGVARFNDDIPGDVLAYLWQDMVRAVFLDDTTLGGLALAVGRGPRDYLYPSAGGETVAVRQTVNVLYSEPYGDP